VIKGWQIQHKGGKDRELVFQTISLNGKPEWMIGYTICGLDGWVLFPVEVRGISSLVLGPTDPPI
jgi:hypothetical protein